MNKVLDNSVRAKNVIIMFYVIIGAYAISLISDIMQYNLLTGGVMDLIQGADANDSRQAAVGLIVGIASIVLIVMFIQWFRRAYHNLHKAKVSGLLASEGWAAGAWFVPILNLFRPYQIMKEIIVETKKYNNTHAGSGIEDDRDIGSSNQMQLAGLWWALWISSSIISNYSAQVTLRSPTVDDLRMSTIASIIGTVLGIGSAFVIIKLIKESQKDQDQFYEVWKDVQEGKDGAGTYQLSDSDEILD